MKVSELAKEFKTTNAHVLEKLRSLKLRAKDGEQELSRAVVIVLKSELIKDMKESGRKTASVKIEKKAPAADAVEKPDEKTEDVKKVRGSKKTAKAPKAEKGADADRTDAPEDAVKSKKKKTKAGQAGADDQAHAAKEAPKTDKKKKDSGIKKADTADEGVPKKEGAGGAADASVISGGHADGGKTPPQEGRGDDRKKPGKGRDEGSKEGGAAPSIGTLDFKIGEDAFKSKRKRPDRAVKVKQIGRAHV